MRKRSGEGKPKKKPSSKPAFTVTPANHPEVQVEYKKMPPEFSQKAIRHKPPGAASPSISREDVESVLKKIKKIKEKI